MVGVVDEVSADAGLCAGASLPFAGARGAWAQGLANAVLVDGAGKRNSVLGAGCEDLAIAVRGGGRRNRLELILSVANLQLLANTVRRMRGTMAGKLVFIVANGGFGADTVVGEGEGSRLVLELKVALGRQVNADAVIGDAGSCVLECVTPGTLGPGDALLRDRVEPSAAGAF